MRVQQRNHVAPAKGRIVRGQRLEDPHQQLVVRPLVQGPAIGAKIHRRGIAGDAEPLRLAVEEWRHVLAVVGVVRLFVGEAQGGHGHDLDVQADRPGARKAVGGVVHRRLAAAEHADHRVDQRRIGERAVAGQPHGDVGAHAFGRLHEPVEHVRLGAAEHGHPLDFGEGDHRVVLGVGGGGDADGVHARRPPHPVDLVGEHRVSGRGHQDLARQAGGGHAGLDHGGNRHVGLPWRLQRVTDGSMWPSPRRRITASLGS